MHPTGGLADRNHYDIGSLVTVDIMLEEPNEGGHFQSLVQHRWTSQDFEVGDALVFVSHKYHRVDPVVLGCRRTLVLELWSGEERACGHRCDTPHGVCGFEEEMKGPNNAARKEALMERFERHKRKLEQSFLPLR
eukprot:gnl/TRDRNA2_/TRDRNA2_161301_c0_seq2.p1 gnl/TRDRNA2_/TRDRNA2_161301_c0~~gnl/TRDRNA2_/TRDRNA2_161301_c0_seq2.p1  ORF type:complete len:135 (+),score=22.27 gnl/TRDRNA2_/TRDRNA2_161301_c0_seq2:49-453(+)